MRQAPEGKHPHAYFGENLPVGLQAQFVQSVCDFCTCQNGTMTAVEVGTHRHEQHLWQNWNRRERRISYLLMSNNYRVQNHILKAVLVSNFPCLLWETGRVTFSFFVFLFFYLLPPYNQVLEVSGCGAL